VKSVAPAQTSERLRRRPLNQGAGLLTIQIYFVRNFCAKPVKVDAELDIFTHFHIPN
jgi:hypothetical protein